MGVLLHGKLTSKSRRRKNSASSACDRKKRGFGQEEKKEGVSTGNQGVSGQKKITATCARVCIMSNLNVSQGVQCSCLVMIHDQAKQNKNARLHALSSLSKP